MDIPKRHKFDPETGKTISVPYNWVNTDGLNREQVLRAILDRFKGMLTLIEDDISDLVEQLHNYARYDPDNPEPVALLSVTNKAIDKLIRLEKDRSKKAKNEILERVLTDIKYDLDFHIKTHFDQGK